MFPEQGIDWMPPGAAMVSYENVFQKSSL